MENSMLVSLIWYPLLLAFAWGLHHQTRCFTNWNLFTILGALLLLFHGAYVPFVLDINSVVDNAQVSSRTKFIFMANIMVSFHMILAGVIIANKLNRFSKNEAKELPDPKKISSGVGAWKLIALVLLMAGVGFYVDSLALGGISFMELLKGNLDAEQFKMSRFLFNHSTSGEQGIVFYFARIMFVSWMLLFVVVTYLMWKGKKRFALPLFAILSFVYLQHALMSGHKAPIAYYLLAIFAARSISKKQRNFKRLIPIGAAMFVLLFFLLLPVMYMLQYSQISYGEGIESALFRLCVEPNRCLMLYFDTYPDRYPFTGLSSIPLVAKVLGLPLVIPAHTYIPMFEHQQIGQSWNVAFFGDGWVGFGWLGTIFFSFVVGYGLQRLNIWFERSPKTVLKSGLYVCLIIAAGKLSATSVTSALMTFGLGTYFILYFIVRKKQGRKSLRKTARKPLGIDAVDIGKLWPDPT